MSDSQSKTAQRAFVSVDVDPCEVALDGISLRFMCAHEHQVERRVAQVYFENDDGIEGWWDLFSLTQDGSDLALAAELERSQSFAKMQLVQDSSAGTARLLYGDRYGLLLRLCDRSEHDAVLTRVAYLLLSENARIKLA
jgi:hypothetical protein